MEFNKNELGEEKVGKLLLHYALPAIIAMTASSLYNVIDRIFIGQGVGPLAISGLALTFPIMNLAIAFGTLVGAGASSMVSIRMGQQRRADAIRILGNALVLNIIIGIAFSVLGLVFLDDLLRLFGASQDTLPYAKEFMQVILAGNVISHIFFGLNNIMRSSGHPTKAMISTLLTVVINIVLAPIFIFYFGWGIRGAAFATIISQTIGMIWVLAHFCSKKPYIHFMPSGFKLSRRIILDIFAIGISPFIINALASLIFILMNLQLRRFGGDFAIGAFGIINSVVSLLVMIILGLTQGMQPIVGYNYGARKLDRALTALKQTIFWATGVSIFGFIIAELFPYQIARAFVNDSEMISIIIRGMRINMMVFYLVGFQIVVSNFFQAIGKAKIAIFLSITRQLLFLVPFLFILPYLFQLDGVWASAAASDLAATISSAWAFIYFYKKLRRGEDFVTI